MTDNIQPDLLTIIYRWWRRILILTIAATLIVFIVLMLMPKKYSSIATALPASAYSTDKSSVFGDNIESLYSALGSSDELDQFLGIARLDTIYLAVTDKLDLSSYYQLTREKDAREKAAQKLKKETSARKTEYGQLKLTVWDKQPAKAAEICNALLEQLRLVHQVMLVQGNVARTAQLKTASGQISVEIDSINSFLSKTQTQTGNVLPYSTRRDVLVNKLSQYEKLITEYEFMSASKPTGLIIIEYPRPAIKAGKPAITRNVLITFAVAFFFFFFMAYVLEINRSGRA